MHFKLLPLIFRPHKSYNCGRKLRAWKLQCRKSREYYKIMKSPHRVNTSQFSNPGYYKERCVEHSLSLDLLPGTVLIVI